MDLPTNIKPNIIKTTSNIDLSKIALMVLILLIGFALGYLANNYISPKILPQQSSQNISAADLSIAINLLKNPIIYQWRGAVEGKLTAKDDKSITLSDDQGHSITIEVTTGSTGTKFSSQSAISQGKLRESVNHLNIPLGTFLRGDFFVIPPKGNQIIGGSFLIKDVK